MPTRLNHQMDTLLDFDYEKPDVIISAEAVDRAKLYRLLKKTYGESDGHNNFRIELRRNQYKIYRTNKSVKQVELSQDQIWDIRAK